MSPALTGGCPREASLRDRSQVTEPWHRHGGFFHPPDESESHPVGGALHLQSQLLAQEVAGMLRSGDTFWS